ncbi:hypothetical protein [Streptomyces liliifuscus]|uniref:Uncharacterized protein n=1 Tax=Streptomyces liliifuscus TaxID=2797636 RepID=A0A7T7L2D2_9ACTN|nr:hypothetical protein [Streptomyces liliifuscus]QQM45182.1 hypothetical protein JEQ17_41125 [Streptomyces liliifuscus]
MIRSNRTRRAIIKARSIATRAAARIARRGTATIASHCLAVGLTRAEASSVAGSLRDKTEKAGVVGVTGRAFRKGAARPCTRYTAREVAALVALYRPRKPAYKLAAAKLALAA